MARHLAPARAGIAANLQVRQRDSMKNTRRTLLLMAVAISLLADVRAGAWGAAGHRVVSRAAIFALPSDVPPFVARQIDWIGSRSVLADSWRGLTEPFSKASEDPNHVW